MPQERKAAFDAMFEKYAGAARAIPQDAREDVLALVLKARVEGLKAAVDLFDAHVALHMDVVPHEVRQGFMDFSSKMTSAFEEVSQDLDASGILGESEAPLG